MFHQETSVETIKTTAVLLIWSDQILSLVFRFEICESAQGFFDRSIVEVTVA